MLVHEPNSGSVVITFILSMYENTSSSFRMQPRITLLVILCRRDTTQNCFQEVSGTPFQFHRLELIMLPTSSIRCPQEALPLRDPSSPHPSSCSTSYHRSPGSSSSWRASCPRLRLQTAFGRIRSLSSRHRHLDLDRLSLPSQS